jgi:hypothetical protein
VRPNLFLKHAVVLFPSRYHPALFIAHPIESAYPEDLEFVPERRGFEEEGRVRKPLERAIAAGFAILLALCAWWLLMR